MASTIKRYFAVFLMLVLILGMLPCVNASAATTQTGVLLFDYSDNGDYTSRLNTQIAVSYKPNGTGSTKTAYIKNLGHHFARINNVPYPDQPLYCIEPYRSYAASTSGNSVDRGVTLNGSGSTTGSSVWYALPADRREAIGLILLYSDIMWDDSISVTTTSRDNNPNVPLRVATQFLIYEIVCGLRNASTFTLNSTNESGTSGDIFYNAGVDAISYFAPNYNQLVSYVQAALEIPSFTSSSSSSAPTITLTGEETVVTDTNGVLSNWSFSDGNGASFYRSGNSLYITQTGDISESTVFTATRSLPSASSSTYNVWYMSGSTYQTCISLYSASSGTASAYFKLKAPAKATLNIVKQTQDGLNLSGWQFGIYSNSACTSLLSGPHTTGSTGTISVTGLSAGTVYVKELGNTNATVNAKYSCASTNPQKVTLTSGGTSSVTFVNNLNTGSITLTKMTEDSKNLSNWQFGIYSDSGCTTLISGPHTTDVNGKLTVTGIPVGTAYIKELGNTDSSITELYVCSSTNPQQVTITGGGTASVSFYNKNKTGSVKLVKETNTGENVANWQIGMYYDADCTNAVDGSPFTTGTDGTITVTGLRPGVTLYAKEEASSDPYWVCDEDVKSVTIVADQTATVTFTNIHYGRIEFKKTTNTGNDLGNWTFRVHDSEGNHIGDYTTDSTGFAQTELLSPGRYMVQELPTDDIFWTVELGWHDVFVEAGETAVDEWHNVDQGLAWFYKTCNTGNVSDLADWEITMYRDEACTDAVSTLTTNADGRVGRYTDPGIYFCKETGDTLDRFEDEYWVIDDTVHRIEVKPHEEVSVTFHNVHCGKLKIIKTMDSEGSLEGWQFRVTDAEGNEIPGSPFTSLEDGTILTGNIAPQELTVEELIPEDSRYYCKSENPQKVTIKAGETAEVTFTNALRPGKITIEKVNMIGEPLAGAKFLLEWSEDGSLWYPVEYSDSEDVGIGGCSNSDLEDGMLTTPDTGILEWNGLYPGLYYRITEKEAPAGYNLLEDVAYEGILTEDNPKLSLRVVNGEAFMLPKTGTATSMIIRIASIICAAICAGLLLISYRKKNR